MMGLQRMCGIVQSGLRDYRFINYELDMHAFYYAYCFLGGYYTLGIDCHTDVSGVWQ